MTMLYKFIPSYVNFDIISHRVRWGPFSIMSRYSFQLCCVYSSFSLKYPCPTYSRKLVVWPSKHFPNSWKKLNMLVWDTCPNLTPHSHVWVTWHSKPGCLKWFSFQFFGPNNYRTYWLMVKSDSFNTLDLTMKCNFKL